MAEFEGEKWFLRCLSCGFETAEDKYYVTCPSCEKGLLEVVMNNPDRKIRPELPSLFKYYEFMPFEEKDLEFLSDKEDYVDPPIFLADNLSEKLGIQLYMIDEMVMPTGTWKDREGLVSIYRLWRNKVSDMMFFSSGNTGTSLSRSATIFKGPKLHLIVPEKSRQRIAKLKQFFDPEFVEVSFFEGSNDECIEECKRVSKERGFVSEGGFSNYARREGLKLLGLQYIHSFDDEVDWYAQPIAGGIGIYSFFKAHEDSGKSCPRMLGVQSTICNPMVNAWNDDSPTLEEKHIPQEVVPSDFVRVLRTRKPVNSYPLLYKIMKDVNGYFDDVTDDEIYEALRMFYEEDYFINLKKEGITVGLEPATALAGVVKGVREGHIAKGSKVLLNVSGAAKEGDVKAEWIADLLN